MDSHKRQFSLRVLAAAAACAAVPLFAQDRASSVSTQLAVSGEVQRPLILSVTELREIGQQKPWVQLGTYTGLRLKDLLETAGIREDAPRALRRTYVVAISTDGYQAVFSWGELFNTAAGNSILVATERDGVPLRDGEGRFAMVALADDRPGPRHVKWLSRIDVRRLPEVRP